MTHQPTLKEQLALVNKVRCEISNAINQLAELAHIPHFSDPRSVIAITHADIACDLLGEAEQDLHHAVAKEDAEAGHTTED